MLANRMVRLPVPFEAVLWPGRRPLRPPGAAPGGDWSGEGLRLVLLHGPSGLVPLGDTRFDLALCGHTHGGQIALPGGRPILTALGRLSRRYNSGVYHLGPGRHLLVTRGIGCTVVPIRVNAPPEVHLVTITVDEDDRTVGR